MQLKTKSSFPPTACPPSAAVSRKANFPHLVPKWAHCWPTLRMPVSLWLQVASLDGADDHSTGGHVEKAEPYIWGVRVLGIWVLPGSLRKGQPYNYNQSKTHWEWKGALLTPSWDRRHMSGLSRAEQDVWTYYSAAFLNPPAFTLTIHSPWKHLLSLCLFPIQAKCHFFHEDVLSLVGMGPVMSGSSTCLTLCLLYYWY